MMRGRRGREMARLELVFAGLLVFVLEPFLFIAAPGSLGPIFGSGQWFDLVPTPVIGMVLGGLGFAWMLRMYPRVPEPAQRIWRSRGR